MPRKRILILANSRKPPGRCVAGREVLRVDDQLVLGDWIRPVSDRHEGGLSLDDCRLEGGGLPQLLDIVSIPLIEPQPTPSQPENWRIDAARYWRKLNLRRHPELEIDEPRNLWLAPRQQLDRITQTELAALRRRRSLNLVEVQDFRIQLGWNEYQGNRTPRRRALFRYNGTAYDLGMTDPSIQARYCTPHPERTQIVRLEAGNNCKLCISLTPELHGCHFKVAAAVIELEDDE